MIRNGDTDTTAAIGELLDTNPWDEREPVTHETILTELGVWGDDEIPSSLAPAVPCEGKDCESEAARVHFDGLAGRFVAKCITCEPIPFTVIDGGLS